VFSLVAQRTVMWHAFGIFATALSVRLMHLWYLRRAPFADVLIGDARGYDEWAQRIAGGEWIHSGPFYQSPLYPYALGVLYAVVGRDVDAVRMLQAVIGSAACALLGVATSRVFGSVRGLMAGYALALYAPAIFFDGLLQKSALDNFFTCLILWILSGIVLPHGQAATRRWFWLGLTMAALSLTRENALALVAVVAVWAVTRGHDGGRLSSSAWSLSRRRVGSLMLGIAVVFAPVAAHNYLTGGTLRLTTVQFGPNFYIGNNPRADGTYASLRPGRGAPEYEQRDATVLAEHAVGRPLSPAEVSSYWTRRAVHFIRAEPMAWLRLQARKFALLWNADEMLDTESQQTHAEWSAVLAILTPIGHFGVLVPLAMFGIAVTWSDRRRIWIFHSMLVVYAASVLVFYVFARYRFPLVPLLLFFAAGGAAAEPLRAHAGRGRLVPALALAVGTLLFTNWPLLSSDLMRAITENNIAIALQDAGRFDEALTRYRRAIALQPDYAPAYNNMGTALRAKGNVDEAMAAYRRALSISPDYPDAHYNLGNALVDQNQLGEAVQHLTIALRALPGSPDAHNNLGLALAAEGKYLEAARQFEAAVSADPLAARPRANLGNALAELERWDEAIRHLEVAVGLARENVTIRYDLGQAFLGAERFADAARELRGVLELAPESASVLNDLGIALAAQGDVHGAIQQFQRALTLDPGLSSARSNLQLAINAQARR
jgi:tetratricopeptide (TPR) repeat protein